MEDAPQRSDNSLSIRQLHQALRPVETIAVIIDKNDKVIACDYSVGSSEIITKETIASGEDFRSLLAPYLKPVYDSMIDTVRLGKANRAGKEVFSGEHIITVEAEAIKLLADSDSDSILIRAKRCPVLNRSHNSFDGLTHAAKDKEQYEYRAAYEELLKTRNAELHSLSNYLQQVRETERKDLAKTIHDEVAQQLMGLKMEIHNLSRRMDSNSGRAALQSEEAEKLIDQIVETVLTISDSLRPSSLDDLGIVAAMEWLNSKLANRYQIPIDMVCFPEDIVLPNEVKTSLFRTYEETLNYATRYLMAKKIDANMQAKDETISLNIHISGYDLNNSLLQPGVSLMMLVVQQQASLVGGDVRINNTAANSSTITILIPFK